MLNFLNKIPVVRTFIRKYKKNTFDKRWRKLNAHNETIVGPRTFPMENVKVGKASYGMLIIQSLFVQEGEELHIGNYVSIAPGVQFMLGVNHQTNTFTTFPLRSKYFSPSPQDALNKGPIIIEDEVWIGTNVLIFSGVRIGKGAIISAGAIVTKDVPAYAIVGGCPAKLIRYRFPDDIIKHLTTIYLKDLPESWIKANIDLLYKELHSEEDVLRLKRAIQEIQ